MTPRSRTLSALLLLSLAACAPHVPAGMGPVTPPTAFDALEESERATVVVAFEESACTGADSAIFLDERGQFIGAVAPGTAAVLPLPVDSSRLFVVASGDVTDIPGAALIRQELARRPGGIVVDIPGADTHNCRGRWSGPLIPVARLTTEADARAHAVGLCWIKPDVAQGNAWLDEYRSRVNEILGRTPDGAPDSRLTEVVPLR